MPTLWHRVASENNNYAGGAVWLDAIAAGSTYRRVRWSWGFSGITNVTTDLALVTANFLVAGLVTTIGNGTETVPQPVSTPNDVLPPTQRWLWWEARQPVAHAVDGASDVVSWRDSGPQEIVDVKSQVLATGIPAGDSLNLWFSWQGWIGAWDSSGQVVIRVAASTLSSSP